MAIKKWYPIQFFFLPFSFSMHHCRILTQMCYQLFENMITNKLLPPKTIQISNVDHIILLWIYMPKMTRCTLNLIYVAI